MSKFNIEMKEGADSLAEALNISVETDNKMFDEVKDFMLDEEKSKGSLAQVVSHFVNKSENEAEFILYNFHISSIFHQMKQQVQSNPMAQLMGILRD